VGWLEHAPWPWDYLLAALRSTQLWKGVVTSTTPTTVYTVPTGKRAIIKLVTAMNAGSATRDLQLRIGGLGTVYHWNLTAYGTGGDKATQAFWIVLNAGETIQLDLTVAGTVSVTISGSEHTV
jgi:hypothetical protein